MEVLVKAAVAEISKLVEDKYAFLHLEISRKQSENESLKRKLLMMENKNAELQRGFGKMLNSSIRAVHLCKLLLTSIVTLPFHLLTLISVVMFMYNLTVNVFRLLIYATVSLQINLNLIFFPP